jgi:cell wall-associated NlpC family hydrolase
MIKNLSPAQKQSLREKIVEFAKKYIGAPYKYGAPLCDEPDAFDCSGFVQFVYKHFGYEIPRSTIQQATFIKKTVADIKKIEVGDLIYLHGVRGYYTKEYPTGIGHVVMYIGNGKIIHAGGIGKKQGVQTGDIKKIISSRKPLVVIKRVI